MRTLPILWRMAEDLRRFATPSSAAAFFEHPWATTYRWTGPSISQLNRLMEENLAKISKDGYQVSINVAEFKPEELSVKVVDNGVIVEGKSEQQNDDNGSYVSRHFLRRLALPHGYVADNAISTLSADGTILTVSIPKPQVEEEKVREIPIQRTETASINSTEGAEDLQNKSAKKDN